MRQAAWHGAVGGVIHMPVTRSNLTDHMGPRGRRAEYTRKCGWIDWAHANPDRDDLKAIWSALKSPPIFPDGRIDRSRVATIKGDDGKRYPYIRVRFSLEMSLKLRIATGFPDHNFTGYVRLDPSNTPTFYKRAALSLFFFACDTVEYHQSSPIVDYVSESSYSMEDMVSNRMAFHQLVEGVSADALIEQIGGWADRDEALRMSQKVMDAMDRVGAKQPRSPDDWDYAYLFNDIADIDDRRGGWQPIPYWFTQAMGRFRTDNPPGSTIGIDWDEEESSASLLPRPGQEPEYLAHLRGHRPGTETGPGYSWRKPGPQGLA
jgi:hypothetical protein